ncbi:MAG TPA: ABC transporter substrate-binding protein [Marinobacter sp.]|uniref:ABC transporter substrate-binding protein n=2 Tax=root TaxID=1 RepID=A0A831R654_9GAMM|nr:ABC transporter substrate-binding protein [Marinobacter antarcticus]HDZ39687.1 ABC transporter substrate-binding protein [Marinobacter sp.]HEA53697.1 ABC transporter substrate-binding protein [Marinobacter antarcticus]
MIRHLRACLVLLCQLPTVVTAQSPVPLTVEAALDREVVAPLLEAFERAHPDIALTYHDRSTLQVNQRARTANPAPDVVISSAMPWQMARVNEGLSQPLDSKTARNWPAWAKWRNEVFGFTFEPIVTVYRLDLARHMVPPSTHADMHSLLRTHQNLLRGRVTTYSPSASGIGLMLFQQDARYSPRFWDLVAAMGAADVSLENNTQAMLDGLTDGTYWLGYNLLGSYALLWARSHPELIVQIPQDYALVMMRMAFVHRDAPNAEAAKIFMDFLLGADGQRVLASDTPLFSVLPEVTGPYTAQRLRDQIGERLYPIPINASLLAFDDPLRRKLFMKRWSREINILGP